MRGVWQVARRAAADAAPPRQLLRAVRGLELIEIDYLSIGPFHAGNIETHQMLLGNNVIIIEGLDLSHVDAAPYELICQPIRIACDGAPCRAVLMPATS